MESEFISDLIDRNTYADVLAVERAEGEAQGKAQGRTESAKLVIASGSMTRQQAIAMLSLTNEEIGILDSLFAQER